ncbi:MAG: flagellar basal body rod protein FlgB [Planctomycetes bacterium]|nr:flagellar basal body rod protein FlgB [Planctomycetota bacterium]
MTSAGGSNDVLLKLMSASALRAKVLSENIANQNVPGYKRKVVLFEELLAQRLDQSSRSIEDVKPLIKTDLETPGSPDGNNVTLELETNSMRENALLYQAYAAILQTKHEMMRVSISERV